MGPGPADARDGLGRVKALSPVLVGHPVVAVVPRPGERDEGIRVARRIGVVGAAFVPIPTTL